MLPHEDGRPLVGGRHHEMLLRLDDDVFAVLTARAWEEDASLSEIVRTALGVYLDGYPRDQSGVSG